MYVADTLIVLQEGDCSNSQLSLLCSILVMNLYSVVLDLHYAALLSTKTLYIVNLSLCTKAF